MTWPPENDPRALLLLKAYGRNPFILGSYCSVRNIDIYVRARHGEKISDLARQYRISTARVRQVIRCVRRRLTGPNYSLCPDTPWIRPEPTWDWVWT